MAQPLTAASLGCQLRSPSLQECTEWLQVRARAAGLPNIPIYLKKKKKVLNLFLHILCLTTAGYLFNFSSPSLPPFTFNFLCVTHRDLPPSDFDSSLHRMCCKQRTKHGRRSASGNYSHLHGRCFIRWCSHVHLLPPYNTTQPFPRSLVLPLEEVGSNSYAVVRLVAWF